MKKLFSLLFTILIITSCKNSEEKTADNTERMELIPEPDKSLNKENIKQNNQKQSTCDFSEPDTSVVGIKIRNVESTLNVLGKKTSLEGDSTHVFYSSDKKQKLGLTVHPGDYRSQVSIFNISYSNNSKQKIKKINFKEFKTEKGIKLGISKSDIIKKLGNCYLAKDSTKNSIELNYRIEQPRDSKTKSLQKNNMPIYYANYKLKYDKLENIEFGFEYP